MRWGREIDDKILFLYCSFTINYLLTATTHGAASPSIGDTESHISSAQNCAIRPSQARKLEGGDQSAEAEYNSQHCLRLFY